MQLAQGTNKTLVITSLIALCLAWSVFGYSGLLSAADIWYHNEIFNHGFLVFPGIAYFIYLKRNQWATHPLTTAKFPLIPIAMAVFVYVVGDIGGIELFKHTASLALFSLIVWLFIGHRAAYSLLFPLVFVFFAIPLGEQLIPVLQEVTADGSVALLQMAGVPLFRSGLYIEIPQGRFLVAEACSGVSFFIASIVVGSVYAYLNFTTWQRRAVFMFISMAFPIVANIIRVFGIILTGYLTDMEHAVGADHLIYGWFFFAIVMIGLIAIGEMMRPKSVSEPAKDTPSTTTVAVNLNISTVAICIFILAIGKAWNLWANARLDVANVDSQPSLSLPSSFAEDRTIELFEVAIVNPTRHIHGTAYINETRNATYDAAYFAGGEQELVSDLHKIYAEKSWTLVETQTLTLSNGTQLISSVISAPNGEHRQLVYWYELAGLKTQSKVQAKLYQTGKALIGAQSGGILTVVTVSKENTTSASDALSALIDPLY